MSNLTKRVLTAAILIPAVLAALFLDSTGWALLILSVITATIAQSEFVKMAWPKDGDAELPGFLWATATAFGGGLVLLTGLMGASSFVVPYLFVATVVVALVVLSRRAALADAGRHVVVLWGSLLYVPALVSFWPLIAGFPNGPRWLFLAIATAALSDTMAYFTGRAFGRHKLYEAVSPNKTWAGAIGGIFGGLIAQIGAGHFWLLPDLPIAHAAILGAGGSFLGQLGDLVESMFKRSFGVKDSGQILPGHGGVLDRIDAILFVAPPIYFYLVYWGS